MREIGIQARVPEQRHRKLRRGDRKGKAYHAGPQNPGMSFGNGSDEVGGASQREGCRKAPTNRGQLPLQPERY